jgi:hypothetical protein
LDYPHVIITGPAGKEQGEHKLLNPFLFTARFSSPKKIRDAEKNKGQL